VIEIICRTGTTRKPDQPKAAITGSRSGDFKPPGGPVAGRFGLPGPVSI
jgi:hypothetical protein